MDRQAAEIAAALSELGLRDAAFDGELIAGQRHADGLRPAAGDAVGREAGPSTYMLFDVLHLDGMTSQARP